MEESLNKENNSNTIDNQITEVNHNEISETKEKSTNINANPSNKKESVSHISATEIASQIRTSGQFDKWRNSLKELYQQSPHFEDVKQKALQILEENKDILQNPSQTRDQKFKDLYKALFQSKSFHQEIKEELNNLIKEELSENMQNECTKILNELERKKKIDQVRVQGEKAAHDFEENDVKPLKEQLKVEENTPTTQDWTDDVDKNEENAIASEGTIVDTTVSDEMAQLSRLIDSQLFGKDNHVEEDFLIQLKNVGDRITIPILGSLGLVVEKDRVLCKVNGKETSGKISRDLRIRWTHPVTQHWNKFDTVSHFVGHVNLNLEPVSKIPLQFDGWTECTLIRDANQMKKETPFVELRRRAVEKLRTLSLENRLNQERVTAHPSFETTQALKRDRSEMENNFQAIEESIGGQINDSTRKSKRQKIDDDEDDEDE